MSDNVAEWTVPYALAHLRITFDRVCKQHPALMEPYMVMLVEIPEAVEETKIMREGLRATFNQRWPAPYL